jgi:hypothetical protein
MRRFLPLLLLVLLLASCGGGRDRFTLKGSFRHLQDGEFYVYSSDPSWSGFDTVRVEDGEFKYSHELTDTTILTVQYPNFMQMQVVAIPGGTVKIKGDANNLLTARISGNDDNDLLTQFRHSIVRKSPAEVLAMAEAFIKAHPASFASLVLLEKYFVNAERFDIEKINNLLALLHKAVPGRTLVSSLQSRFEPFARTLPGRPLPAFAATTLKGEKVSNATFRGKPLLIWLWSTWGPEQSYSVMQQHATMRPYRGRVGLLNVCLDADTADCRRLIRQDTVPGHVVCDRLSWESPLVRSFGVRRLPTPILVDAAGKVVCRDVDEATVMEKLKTLIKAAP